MEQTDGCDSTGMLKLRALVRSLFVHTGVPDPPEGPLGQGIGSGQRFCFNLATAAPFWILLELGKADTNCTDLHE